MQDRNTRKQFGMIYVIIHESVFSKLYSSFTTEGNDVVMISSTGTILSSNKHDLIGTNNENLLNEAKKILSEKSIDPLLLSIYQFLLVMETRTGY
mgnify:CR=1 FL=1